MRTPRKHSSDVGADAVQQLAGGVRAVTVFGGSGVRVRAPLGAAWRLWALLGNGEGG
jgi:hypothetical protein